MNELFDKLQEYIDKKITGMENNLEELFQEYGLKTILDNLDSINLVSVNIDAVITTSIGMNDIITVSRNMTDVIKVPELLEQIEEQVNEAEVLYDQTVAERQVAHRWAQEEFQAPVDDGTHTGYSSYHWSRVSESNTYSLTFRGDWDPNTDTYPTANAHGDYWIVSEYDDDFDGQEWIAGDTLIWKDDTEGQAWVHKKESVHWIQIVGKPSAFTPKPHYHSEYVQVDNLIPYSEGASSAGYPIKLWLDGTIHNSMLNLPVTYIVGTFTPLPNDEYPNTIDHEIGASWLISEVHVNDGYTFFDGQLQSRTVKNGDVLVWSYEGWIIKYDKLLPETYLKRNGEYPMWGNLQMGNNRIVDTMDGIEDTDVATVGQLGSRLDEVFLKSDFITTSGGTGDMGKPIVLNQYGLVDPSMISFNTLIIVGDWDPSGGDEYPDIPTIEPGYSWRVNGVPDTGYTFIGGDLAGKITYPGDWMIYSQSGWILSPVKIDIVDYYRLDGSNPLEADFNGGGYRISHIADAISDDDAITKYQFDDGMTRKAEMNHTHTPTSISPQGSGSGLNADLLDGYDSTDFIRVGSNINPGQIQPQGTDSGLDADKLDGRHGDEYFNTIDGVNWTNLVNVPDEFDPVKATQQRVGGIRIWADGDILNIANDDYIA